MNKWTYLVMISFVLLFTFFYFNLDLNFITGNVVGAQEEYSIDIMFCPQDDCENNFITFLDSAKKSIHCALFDVGLESVQDKLVEKSYLLDVKIVTDDRYYNKFSRKFVKKDQSGLMHNKFCVIDGVKISTGSMNITDNGVNKNNNNLIFIEHSQIANNYEEEFQEMWDGLFKKGEMTKKQSEIETYFCPEDYCAYRVKQELKKAEESIYFMTFSFTHEEIANILLLKHLDGIFVKGVMEARQVTKYSQFERLKYNGVDVVKDGNKNNMHHKVFIIDSKTVITGSFNPTNGGDRVNDENLLIIHNEEIAGMFEREFLNIYMK